MHCNTKGTSFAIVGGHQLILTKKGKFMKYQLQSPGTSCAFHPKHDRLAVGTKGGGIFVFNNYEKGLRNPSFYHWHSHAVKALQFTSGNIVCFVFVFCGLFFLSKVDANTKGKVNVSSAIILKS